MEVKMTLFIAAFVVALASVTYVEATGYSQGTIISWVDPNVGSLLGVMWRYKNYGCACGADLNGKPLDKIDCCCQTHNKCYQRLTNKGICSHNPFDASYNFKKTKNHLNKHTIHCEPSSDQCGYEVCQCDAAVAECFAQNGSHYSSHHKKYKQSSCDHSNTKTDICD